MLTLAVPVLPWLSVAVLASVLNDYGTFLSDAGMPVRAEPPLREAWQLYGRLRGPSHVTTALVAGNLGAALIAQNRFAEAEPILHDAVTALDSAGDDPRFAEPLFNYGYALLALGRRPPAEAVLRRLYAAEPRAHPPDDWRVVRARVVLGTCLAAQQQFAEAEPLLTSGFEALRRQRGPRDGYTQQTARTLVRLYTDWNRPADAARYQSVVDAK